jgi:hypothetical protein
MPIRLILPRSYAERRRRCRAAARNQTNLNIPAHAKRRSRRGNATIMAAILCPTAKLVTSAVQLAAAGLAGFAALRSGARPPIE